MVLAGAVMVTLAGLAAAPVAPASVDPCPDPYGWYSPSGYEPSVAASADGTRVSVVWSRPSGKRWRVYASGSSDGGTSWRAPTAVSAAGRSSVDPDVAAADDGMRLAVVWGRRWDKRQSIQVVTSRDGGVTWDGPATVYRRRAGTGGYRVVSSADGRLLTVVWGRIPPGHGIQASSSSDGGRTWTGYAFITGSPESRRTPPEATSSADGRVVTVLANGYMMGPTAITTTDGGTSWGPPKGLVRGYGDEAPGQVASSLDGTVAVAVVEDYTFTDGTTLNAVRSVDAGATWQPQVQLPGRGIHPQVTVSSDGARVSAAWAAGAPGSQVVQVAGSADSGATWSAPVDVSVPGSVCALRLTASADGSRLTAAWSGGDGDVPVLLTAGSSDGGATWGAQRALTPAGVKVDTPHLVSSADGLRVSAVWQAKDAGRWLVQASSSADGGRTWGAPLVLGG